MNGKKLLRVTKLFIPLAIIVVGLCGLVYLSVQQSLRQGANDPQIQLAEDEAGALSSGQNSIPIMSQGRIDASKSLAPFVVIYDNQGGFVTSTITSNAQSLEIPSGVLDYVKTHGEDRITWQPNPNLRIAAVIAAVDGGGKGYVLAGRSLKEIERRENTLLMEVGEASLSILLVLFVACLILV